MSADFESVSQWSAGGQSDKYQLGNNCFQPDLATATVIKRKITVDNINPRERRHSDVDVT